VTGSSHVYCASHTNLVLTPKALSFANISAVHQLMQRLECTYDRPSSRSRRFPATSAEAIENRLQQIESTLHAVVDRGLNHVPTPQTGPVHQKVSTSNDQTQTEPSGTGNRLEIALDASDRLDVNDSGHHDFHGHSSGVAFLAQIRHKYEDLLSPEVGSDTTVETSAELPQIFDSRHSFKAPIALIPPTLPSRATAEDLVESALEYVCVLSRTLHRPTFDAMFNRVYDLGAAKHEAEELRFLPLLYSIMAVGSFASNIKDEGSGNKRVMAAG